MADLLILDTALCHGPAEFDAGKEQVVTITGANFSAATMVQVSDRMLTDVQWVDEQTLRVTLPAESKRGIVRRDHLHGYISHRSIATGSDR